jgi:hypothetical protein
MEAILWNAQAAPVGTEELLHYTPPAGSTVAGGMLQVGLYADGYGTGSDMYDFGSAGVLEPGPDVTTANVVKVCTQSQHVCQNGTDDYLGPISLPADAGGDVYLFANCNGFNVNGGCNAGGSENAWALAQLSSAQVLLRNDAVPQGTGFAGTILAPHATGNASLGFTASDPAGPGVYRVVVQVDGHVVFAGTPNANDGACAPVGTDAATGALMFDHQQPCPQSEPILLSVPTAGLRDGRHSLTVAVGDAAGNASQVLATPITTRNSGSTRTRLPRLHVRLTFRWRWNGRHTRLGRPSAAADAAVRRSPEPAARLAGCSRRCGATCSPPATAFASPSRPLVTGRSRCSSRSAPAVCRARSWFVEAEPADQLVSRRKRPVRSRRSRRRPSRGQPRRGTARRRRERRRRPP